MTTTRPPTASTLTGHILHQLLCHQLATTDQLREFLADQVNAAVPLDDRLEVLHAQDLTARHQGAWHLTPEGLAVARTLPESAGLCPDRPPHARTALAMTALGISFLRQHRAAFGGAPFIWDTQVTHHFRDPRGDPAQVTAGARLRTCRPTPDGLLVMDALVSYWPGRRSQDDINRQLLALARFEGGCPAARGCQRRAWWRWYPASPHLLFAAEPRRGDLHHLLNQVAAAARAEPEIAGLLSRVPLRVASQEDLGQHGGPGEVWMSPMCPERQVWTELQCGMGKFE